MPDATAAKARRAVEAAMDGEEEDVEQQPADTTENEDILDQSAPNEYDEHVHQPEAEGQEIPHSSAPTETKHASKLSNTIEKVKVFSYILLAYTSAKAHAIIVSRALNASTGPDAFAALAKLNG
jgi:hypothetical protein